MTYPEAVSYLLTFGQELRGAKFDLANVSVLLGDLGRPQQAWRAVHIAGTNGKGSTAAMIEAVLRAAGLRTGLYTSPHLARVNERIRVEGVEIGDDELAALCTEVRAATERLLARQALPSLPSFFESLTAIAFEHFRRARCELVMLEAGMGGRLDATNVVTPLASVITRVDFDHEAYLGHTLEKIAFEKAGIIKPGVPVVTVRQRPEAMAVIEQTAGERGARLSIADPARVEAGGFRLRLPGRHQLENAAAALCAFDELRRQGFDIPDAAIRQGLESVEWPGRLELLPGSPELLLDGAHNPAGARALRAYLDELFAGRRIVLLFGAMRDKAVGEIADLLFPGAAAVVLTRPLQRRAASPEALAEVTRHLNPRVSLCENSADGLRAARAMAGPAGVVVVTGSLYLVGEVKQHLARN
jgi:dihydrofolate synthase/folylpolyglutamate synthase